jgi:hypothetical protein
MHAGYGRRGGGRNGRRRRRRRRRRVHETRPGVTTQWAPIREQIFSLDGRHR